MAEVQAWFAPLLWVLATIGTIIAFIRVIKPVYQSLKNPEAFTKALAETNLAIEKMSRQINEKLAGYENELASLRAINDKQTEVQLSLLHDRILQIYQAAKEAGCLIQDEDYKRVCALHAQDGDSDYIESIMEILSEWHKQTLLKEGESHETAG